MYNRFLNQFNMAFAMSQDEELVLGDDLDREPTLRANAFGSEVEEAAGESDVFVDVGDDHVEHQELDSVGGLIRSIAFELMQHPCMDVAMVRNDVRPLLMDLENPELAEIKDTLIKLAKLFDVYSLSRPEVIGEFSSLTIDKGVWLGENDLRRLSGDKSVLLACKIDQSVVCGQVLDETQLAMLQNLFAGIIGADDVRRLFNLSDSDTPVSRSIHSLAATFQHAKKLGPHALGILIKHFYRDSSLMRQPAITSIDDLNQYPELGSCANVPVVYVLTRMQKVRGR